MAKTGGSHVFFSLKAVFSGFYPLNSRNIPAGQRAEREGREFAADPAGFLAQNPQGGMSAEDRATLERFATQIGGAAGTLRTLQEQIERQLRELDALLSRVAGPETRPGGRVFVNQGFARLELRCAQAVGEVESILNPK